MRVPTATYRIQFNAEFGFEAAQAIIGYLQDLGISDLYASPIFKARAGSSHGYDVVDPTQLNPELGPPEAFAGLIADLKQRQMGWVQDIVPNHMAYDSQNQWLMNTLENGPDSIHADFFDIAWSAPFAGSQEPVLTPLLGNFYGECLENGEIQLAYGPDGLTVNYYGLSLPLKPESYPTFLSYHLGKLVRTLGRKHPDLIKLLGILYILKNLSADVVDKQRQDQVDFVKGLLWELYSDNPEIKTFIDDNIQVFNGEQGQPESFDLLDNLLSDQFFRLSHWKVGAEEINYRRFFTVNELISVKVEDLKVFNQTHALIAQLVSDGSITGLRIDHIDGLYDPTQYLQRLREKTGDAYITVEKILQPGEKLPRAWPVQGTSGYDYLNYVNGLFCQTDQEEPFDAIYREITRFQADFEQLALEKKHLILDKNLAGDLDNLAYLLKTIASHYRYGSDFTINGLKRAIAEVLIRFPIYRTYIDQEGVSESDRAYIEAAIAEAKTHSFFLTNELSFLEKLLLLQYEESLSETDKEQWLYFVMRLQQYTGPLMAKGVEDTALYVYNRLLSLNEVGGEPARFGVALDEFHAFNQERQLHWPQAMNATATHDTKRGEDVRARLNVLSEIPEEWQQQVRTWSEINQSLKTKVKGGAFPDRNDEYGFYQTLVGAYPFADHDLPGFADRVKEYGIKAIREAKVYTAWLRPNPLYEDACTQFLQGLLDPAANNRFLEAFLPFQQKVANYGIFNSLSQTLLKAASPGVPDFYQGTELWDLSLVDPDNRRPVDFEQRQSYLNAIQEQAQTNILSLIQDLLATKEDGRIKLFLTTQVLKARSRYLEVFRDGDYLPISAQGKWGEHVVAFARRSGGRTILAVAPRFLMRLIQPGEYPLGDSVWEDTSLQLPPDAPSAWQDLITQQRLDTAGSLSMGDVLKFFPVALLVAEGDA